MDRIAPSISQLVRKSSPSARRRHESSGYRRSYARRYAMRRLDRQRFVRPPGISHSQERGEQLPQKRACRSSQAKRKLHGRVFGSFASGGLSKNAQESNVSLSTSKN